MRTRSICVLRVQHKVWCCTAGDPYIQNTLTLHDGLSISAVSTFCLHNCFKSLSRLSGDCSVSYVSSPGSASSKSGCGLVLIRCIAFGMASYINLIALCLNSRRPALRTLSLDSLEECTTTHPAAVSGRGNFGCFHHSTQHTSCQCIDSTTPYRCLGTLKLMRDSSNLVYFNAPDMQWTLCQC